MGGVDTGVQDGDLDALAVVAGRPRLGGADLRHGLVEGCLADAVEPDVGDTGGGVVPVGDGVPQLGRVLVRGLHGVRVQGLQGPADRARVADVGLGARRAAPVADDDLQAPLLGAAGRGLVQLGDVEEPLVQLATGDQPGRVHRQHEGVAVDPADLDGYVLPPLGPLQPDDAARGVHRDPVTRDQGDPVPGLRPGRGTGVCAFCVRRRRTGAHAFPVGRRGAGHARRERHSGRRGERGQARSLHLSAQGSP